MGFSVSTPPPQAGCAICEAKAISRNKPEISKFVFLTSLPCFSHVPSTLLQPTPRSGRQWTLWPCVALAQPSRRDSPSPQSSVTGSASQHQILWVLLATRLSQGELLRVPNSCHPSLDFASLSEKCSTQRGLQNTGSVHVSWANTFPTSSLHNQYTDNGGNS